MTWLEYKFWKYPTKIHCGFRSMTGSEEFWIPVPLLSSSVPQASDTCPSNAISMATCPGLFSNEEAFRTIKNIMKEI